MTDEAEIGLIKVFFVWLAVLIGSITLSQTVLFLTGVFTILQIFKLTRELHRDKRLEALEALLRHQDSTKTPQPQSDQTKG